MSEPTTDPRRVVEKLKALSLWLATAESCTGGQVAREITGVSGASLVYWGGWVVYDNTAKQALGVPLETLQKYGAVSREVASALAQAGLEAMRKARPDTHGICVATTGIAGPTGGTDVKPVGLCHIAVASERGGIQTREVRTGHGDRTLNQKEFTQAALELMERTLNHE